MSARILVIEDQKDIAELVQLHLRDLGHNVDIVGDGKSGLDMAAQYDLLVLDGMLPAMDGLDVLRALRQKNVSLPVLMLTARASELDRVIGLETGADDYLPKPFSIAELQARVKALLRRSTIQNHRGAGPAEANIPSALTAASLNHVLSHGQLRIDLNAHEAWFANRPLSLTSKEFDLLLHFAKTPGRVFTRTQLLEAVWGTSYEGYELSVNTHINRLRAKLEIDPAKPQIIQTVRGVGYRLAPSLSPQVISTN